MSGRPVPPRNATSSIVSAARRTSRPLHARATAADASARPAWQPGRRVEHGLQSSVSSVAGGVLAKRRAAGIVGADAEAQQLGRDAARQFAVAGDQRGAAARRLDRLPQRHRDRHRLVALARRLDQRHAVPAPPRHRRRARRRAARPSHRWFRPAAAPPTPVRRAAPAPACAGPISATSARASRCGAAALPGRTADGRGRPASACRRPAPPRTARRDRGRGRAARPRRAAGAQSPEAIRRSPGSSRSSRRR